MFPQVDDAQQQANDDADENRQDDTDHGRERPFQIADLRQDDVAEQVELSPGQCAVRRELTKHHD